MDFNLLYTSARSPGSDSAKHLAVPVRKFPPLLQKHEFASERVPEAQLDVVDAWFKQSYAVTGKSKKSIVTATHGMDVRTSAIRAGGRIDNLCSPSIVSESVGAPAVYQVRILRQGRKGVVTVCDLEKLVDQTEKKKGRLSRPPPAIMVLSKKLEAQKPD